MIVTLNTHSVTKELRPYLLMLLDLIIESPIRHGENLISYEEVVTALEKDTIAMGTRLGLESNTAFSCGPFSHTASLMIQVETKKYEKGINWLVDLLHNTEFTVDRVRVIAAKMANSISQFKRKGNFVVRELLKALLYEDGELLFNWLNMSLCLYSYAFFRHKREVEFNVVSAKVFNISHSVIG